jgi:hypothetical protein
MHKNVADAGTWEREEVQVAEVRVYACRAREIVRRSFYTAIPLMQKLYHR